jgi:hypothetical protein
MAAATGVDLLALFAVATLAVLEHKLLRLNDAQELHDGVKAGLARLYVPALAVASCRRTPTSGPHALTVTAYLHALTVIAYPHTLTVIAYPHTLTMIAHACT